MQEIYFKKDFKDKLLNGINKLRDAVASTMGPNGNTVIITDQYGNPYVTKDGVSVADAITFKDPIENTGAIMIKEVAKKTVNEAGDGTTTAIVLATTFINNLKDYKIKDINKAFDEIIPKVLEELKKNSRQLQREDIKYVASISANNDTQIGDTIQQAYNFSDIVKVEESSNNTDKLELINGMKLQTSYMSKHFITNEKKGSCEMNEPYILLLDGKLENLKLFEVPIQAVSAEDAELLIITEHVSENILRLLETNVISRNIKLCVMKTPGFGQHRRDLIKDLSYFTGSKIINDFTKPIDKYTSVLGKLKSANISKNFSILTKHEDINIDDYISELRELTLDGDELTKQRYENLTGKVSVIKVGGGSELEMKERYDRYDDAVKAVSCALEEGIVEGGGIALKNAAFNLNHSAIHSDIYDKIYESFAAPTNCILNNGSLDHRFLNMFDENIIDPLKVTRTALENAVSVAKTILSTETIVLNERQW